MSTNLPFNAAQCRTANNLPNNIGHLFWWTENLINSITCVYNIIRKPNCHSQNSDANFSPLFLFRLIFLVACLRWPLTTHSHCVHWPLFLLAIPKWQRMKRNWKLVEVAVIGNHTAAYKYFKSAGSWQQKGHCMKNEWHFHLTISKSYENWLNGKVSLFSCVCAFVVFGVCVSLCISVCLQQIREIIVQFRVDLKWISCKLRPEQRSQLIRETYTHTHTRTYASHSLGCNFPNE